MTHTRTHTRINRLAPVEPLGLRPWGQWDVQCIQKYFSQTLFDFNRMVSHLISPKFSGRIPYVLSKPRICFLGSNDKTLLF